MSLPYIEVSFYLSCSSLLISSANIQRSMCFWSSLWLMGVVTGIQREPIWTSTGCTSHEFLLYLPISHPWLGNRQCASASRVWCWGRTCDGPGARLKSFSNPYNCVMREILSSIPFFEWRNWASEKQKKKKFQVSLSARDDARVWSQGLPRS